MSFFILNKDMFKEEKDLRFLVHWLQEIYQTTVLKTKNCCFIWYGGAFYNTEPGQ